MTDHYFTDEPAAPSRRRVIEFAVAGRSFRLLTDSGVFSAHRLDLGTSVLLRKASLPTTPGTYLDLGCGYGPIACVLASMAPGSTVYAVDTNSRARELTQQNANTLRIADQVVVAAPDEVPDDVRFDEIWSNPPIRIGKQALHALLEQWLSRLTPDGVAWLVVARNLGSDSLHEWLKEQGWDAQRWASQKGFRVLRVQPGKAAQ